MPGLIQTGEQLWKSGSFQIDYQTPVIVRQDGKAMMVAAGRKNLFAFDPANGNVAWSFPHNGGGGRGASSLTPVPIGKDHFFSAIRMTPPPWSR